MSLRTSLPAEDLYARLEVPTDASPEAIEVAWRGLLRKHHPDVAGHDALDLAKRINVAHDWLSDPALRRRYDDERGIGRPGRSIRSDRADRADRAGWGFGARAAHGDGAYARTAPRPPTVGERAAAIVAQVTLLTPDELDRLALAEPAPIAFLATLRRFALPERQSLLDDAERAAIGALPSAVRRRPAVRDAIVGRLAEIVLDDSLDGLLGESGADRARERLTRGWDAAIGQPRYGPATNAVAELLQRLADLSQIELEALARTGTRERLGPVPWPRSVSPDEDEALRVSSDLASSDAAAALIRAGDGSAALGARRAAARIAHLLVLRHAFTQVEFERLASVWLGTLIARLGPWGARVGQRR